MKTIEVVDNARVGKKGFPRHYQAHGAEPPMKLVVVSESGVPSDETVEPPRTPEEARERMQPLTRRQFWLAANSIGLSKSDVLAAVGNDVELQIEVEESTEFGRTYDSIVLLAPLLGITPEQLDDIWNWASSV
ncbi:hypothetical protein GA830_12255 [Mesorhizobium sp. NBSH29]|uniref:hypothetical protein n=1 Tax=Mesorhizobium sp. NBSH29 TaxID=2654249 RepID=UPI00189659AF|nr:hypothetical protein [Mesorhizobium sp. NBSH29]QPC87430.1 hypothetical protein GA830_12255 [Mesorhizobium sp. NBSH29]